MEVPVSIDRRTFEVTPKGEYAMEITGVIQQPEGRLYIIYGHTRHLTAAEITRLLGTGDTLEQMGITLDTTHPVLGFDAYLSNLATGGQSSHAAPKPVSGPAAK